MKTRSTVLAALLLLGLSPTLAAKPRSARNEARPTVVASGVNHTVKRGETLYSIAEKYYGSGLQWVKLAEYNPWVMEQGGPDKLNVGEIIHIPEPRSAPREEWAKTSFDPPSARSLFGMVPDLSGFTLFGRSVYQLCLILLVWFLIHFVSQGLFVWFAAHLAFVKDVSMKKAMKATLQSESLATICIVMAAVVGLMLIYVGTTSPGNPVTPELLTTAESYLASPSGIILAGLLLVGLYGFLGLRFIPPAFGLPTGRGLAVVLIAILIPHLVGFYLVSHRMGLIN